MKPWQMIVKLENGLTIENPDIRCYDMDWGSQLYSSGIEFIRLCLPGRIFTFVGYEKYNFFLEVLQDAMISKTKAKLEAIFICGSVDGYVDVLKITKDGLIVFRKPFGQEYAGTASRGWKAGVKRSEAKILQEKTNDSVVSLQS